MRIYPNRILRKKGRVFGLNSLGQPPAQAFPVSEEFWKRGEEYREVEKAVIEANRKKYFFR